MTLPSVHILLRKHSLAKATIVAGEKQTIAVITHHDNTGPRVHAIPVNIPICSVSCCNLAWRRLVQGLVESTMLIQSPSFRKVPRERLVGYISFLQGSIICGESVCPNFIYIWLRVVNDSHLA